ncbi:MAG: DUF1638 domain-containing protein [Geminicoccaceae bacterium]
MVEQPAGLCSMTSSPPVRRNLVIACGALAREIRVLIEVNGFDHLDLVCLPASLHNRPELIPEAVRTRIREKRDHYEKIYCAYADCGTGGMLDSVLAMEGVPRIGGAHCYAFFAGQEAFAALAEAEPGTFYLTDFLVRQFETLVIEGMGLDRHPDLLGLYFGNYTKLVYLSQTADAGLLEQAKAAAGRLALAFEHVETGMGELAGFIKLAASGEGEPPAAPPAGKFPNEPASGRPGSVLRRTSARTRGRHRGRSNRRN